LKTGRTIGGVFKLVEFTETDGIVGKLELTAVWTILGFI
jgi:hypothetical protein